MTAAQFFATPSQFRLWLAAHASTSAELIVGFHKVGTGRPSMGWSEAVDEAICVGWIAEEKLFEACAAGKRLH